MNTSVLEQKSMVIGLDYDGTITCDPELWVNTILEFKKRNHIVYVVTMRYSTEVTPILALLNSVGIRVIYTGRQAKRPICEQQGIYIDIWIDDNPRAVNESADQIWPISVPEGQADTFLSETAAE